ncbi:MAG: beta-ketoacyl-[acyl-carrier-protein] synthase family protein [Solirubrobacterales bacterium]|nr:beta-ketoacyl-[acyl-carrier-protein] synthase family protein [Solirubrobacterales bacterium]
MGRRVAITGVGLCTPLGIGTEATWEGLVGARSAVGEISSYDPSTLHTQLGAEIGEFKPRDYVEHRRSLRTMTRHDVLTLVAAVLAMQDAMLEPADDVDGRAAAFAAGGKETSVPDELTDVALEARDEDGVVDTARFGEIAMRGVPPLFFLQGLQGAALHYLSEAFSMRGSNTYFAGTAEAGLHAIGRGYRAVRRGEADLALAGGGDAPVNWWNMAKIDALGMTTRRNDLGAAACRPFDRDRDGTVLGEGGAFLVLEELEAARARGAHVYGEIVGYGAASDVGRYVTPDPQGRPIVQAMRAALREAGASPDDVAYVATHGSGTRLGDASEAAALRTLSNGAAPLASSVKPATGHLMAAAGALNAAVVALAADRGQLPPTLNLEAVDTGCDGIEWVTGATHEARVPLGLALARGVEGQVVALAMRGV